MIGALVVLYFMYRCDRRLDSICRALWLEMKRKDRAHIGRCDYFPRAAHMRGKKNFFMVQGDFHDREGTHLRSMMKPVSIYTMEFVFSPSRLTRPTDHQIGFALLA
jgi:hypothetical protein